MPIYEYACNQCHHRFEKLLRRSEDAVECPHCQQSDLRKLFSAFSSPQSGGEEMPMSCPPGGCGSCVDQGFCSMN